jgi:hypothetical protein
MERNLRTLVFVAVFTAAFAAVHGVQAQEAVSPPAPQPAPPAPSTAVAPQAPAVAPVAAKAPAAPQTTSTGLIIIPVKPSSAPAWNTGSRDGMGGRSARLERPKPDLKPLAVLGLSAGVQAVGVAFALLASGLDYGLSDASMEISYGVMLGLTPIADGMLGWLVMRRSVRFDAPIFSTILGAYVGAAISYVCLYFFQEADDPKVDGKYDDIWFQNDGADNRVGAGTMVRVVVPILLPAIGAGLGALAGRKPLVEPKGLTLAPPMPIAFSSGERGGAVPGVLLSGVF